MKTNKLMFISLNLIAALAVIGFVSADLPADCSATVTGFCTCTGASAIALNIPFNCCNTLVAGCCQRTCRSYRCIPLDGGSCTPGPAIVYAGSAQIGTVCQSNGLCGVPG